LNDEELVDVLKSKGLGIYGSREEK